MFIKEITSEELRQIRGKGNFLVPFGSIEAHGPHLPMGTDSIIIEHVLRSLPDNISNNILICPQFTLNPTNYVRTQGKDGETNLKLCLHLWSDFTFDVLKNYIDAYRPKKILLISWHDTPDFLSGLRHVCYKLHEETKRKIEVLRIWVLAKEYALKNGIVGSEERHAAKIETSILQFLAADLVKTDLRQNIRWEKKEYLGIDWSSFIDEGIYGNALESNPETGKEIVNFVCSESAKFISEYFSLS